MKNARKTARVAAACAALCSMYAMPAHAARIDIRQLHSDPIANLCVQRRAQLVERPLTLRRRGAHVLRIGPDPPAAEAIGPDLMRPEPRDAVLTAGYRQGAALAGG